MPSEADTRDLPVVRNRLPAFEGTTWEEHVSAWLTLDESLQNHLWMLGA